MKLKLNPKIIDLMVTKRCLKFASEPDNINWINYFDFFKTGYSGWEKNKEYKCCFKYVIFKIRLYKTCYKKSYDFFVLNIRISWIKDVKLSLRNKNKTVSYDFMFGLLTNCPFYICSNVFRFERQRESLTQLK